MFSTCPFICMSVHVCLCVCVPSRIILGPSCHQFLVVTDSFVFLGHVLCLLHLIVSFSARIKKTFQTSWHLVLCYTLMYRVWNIQAMTHSAVKVLPHPSFVYTAKYHMDVGNLVVTGGFDRLLRVWNLQSKGSTACVWPRFLHLRNCGIELCSCRNAAIFDFVSKS